MQRLTFFLLLVARLCWTYGNADTNWEDIPESTDETGIHWHACPDGYRVHTLCMRLRVPLDYDDLAAGTITLAFMKDSISEPQFQGVRRNEMLVILGGPGRSGLEDLVSGQIPSRHVLGNKHEIIAFDPRGVGHSGPNLDCFGGNLTASYQLASSEYSFASSSRNTTFEKAGIWGDLCKKNLDDSARYIGTPAVARDMLYYFDLQARTGYGMDPNVNFYGAGYGAVVGATFASLYPERVGRFVLDSPTGRNAYYSDVNRNNLRIQDAAVHEFFNQCWHAGRNGCKFWQPSPRKIEARYNRLLNKLKDHPLRIPFIGAPVDTSVQVTADSVRARLLSATYQGHITFRRLAEQLADLEIGEYHSWDKKYLMAPSCTTCTLDDWQYLHETFQNPVSKHWNQWAAYAISCLDLAPQGRLTLGEFDTLMKDTQQINPYTGIASASMAYCSKWPLTPPPSQSFSMSFGGYTRNPLQIITNTYDPVTPITFARELNKLFRDSRLTEQNIVAHGAASWGDCINGRVQDYFETGRPFDYGMTKKRVCKPGISGYSTTYKPSLPPRD